MSIAYCVAAWICQQAVMFSDQLMCAHTWPGLCSGPTRPDTPEYANRGRHNKELLTSTRQETHLCEAESAWIRIDYPDLRNRESYSTLKRKLKYIFDFKFWRYTDTRSKMVLHQSGALPI